MTGEFLKNLPEDTKHRAEACLDDEDAICGIYRGLQEIMKFVDGCISLRLV